MENGIYEGLEEEKEGKKCKYSIISGKRWSSNLNMIVWSTTYKQKYMATFSFLRHLREYYALSSTRKKIVTHVVYVLVLLFTQAHNTHLEYP